MRLTKRHATTAIKVRSLPAPAATDSQLQPPAAAGGGGGAAAAIVFRLQLSNSGATDETIGAILAREEERLLEAFTTSPQGAARSAELGRALTFADVPVIELTLNRNRLGDAALPFVAAFIAGNAHVVSLELLSNNFSDAGAPLLAEIIKSGTLQRLKLGDNALTAAGVQIIADALRDSRSRLVQLHLSGNAIGDAGVAAVADACAAAVAHAPTVLCLRDVDLSDAGWGALGALAVVTASQGERPPIELHLKGNPLTISAARAFVAPLAAAPAFNGPRFLNLSLLSVPSCGMTAASCAVLCDALRHCAALTHLDVSDNALGDFGICQLAEALHVGGSKETMRLTEFAASAVGMTSTGLRALLPTLPSPTQPVFPAALTSIDISANDFSDADSVRAALPRLLGGAPALRSLLISGCNVPADAVPALCSAIKDHGALTEVDFGANFSASDAAVNSLVDLVRDSSRLQRLVLTDNGLGAQAVDAIVIALAESRNRNITQVRIGGQSTTPPVANAAPASSLEMLATVLARNRAASRPAARLSLSVSSSSGSSAPSSTPKIGAHPPPPTFTAAAADARATVGRGPPQHQHVMAARHQHQPQHQHFAFVQQQVMVAQPPPGSAVTALPQPLYLAPQFQPHMSLPLFYGNQPQHLQQQHHFVQFVPQGPMAMAPHQPLHTQHQFIHPHHAQPGSLFVVLPNSPAPTAAAPGFPTMWLTGHPAHN